MCSELGGQRDPATTMHFAASATRPARTARTRIRALRAVQVLALTALDAFTGDCLPPVAILLVLV